MKITREQFEDSLGNLANPPLLRSVFGSKESVPAAFLLEPKVTRAMHTKWQMMISRNPKTWEYFEKWIDDGNSGAIGAARYLLLLFRQPWFAAGEMREIAARCARRLASQSEVILPVASLDAISTGERGGVVTADLYEGAWHAFRTCRFSMASCAYKAVQAAWFLCHEEISEAANCVARLLPVFSYEQVRPAMIERLLSEKE